MKLIMGMAFLATAAFGLSGCEIVKGAGQDIQSAGAAVTETADDVQDDL